MDPLSLSASIIAVLHLTGKLLSYLNDVRNATKDQAQLAVEASNVYSLLVALRFRVEQSNNQDPWFMAVHSFATENGPLVQLRKALEVLTSNVEPTYGIKRLGKQLLWMFEKSEMGETLDRIERVKTLVSIALTSDLFTLSQAINKELGAIGNEVYGISEGVTALHASQQRIGEGVSNLGHGLNALNTRQQNEERHKIGCWLSPVDFRSRYQEILKGAQVGTRQWLFDSEEFRRWVFADQGTLWCPGIPGAGKTVTSAIVINHLQSSHKNTNTAVTFLFCNYRDRAAQSAEIFMANLLKQVIQQQWMVSTELRDIYNERKNGRLTFAESAKLFRHEISHFSKVFVVIDALDETSEHEDIRRLVLSELQTLPVNLLVTSRYEKSIKQKLGEAERLDIRATAADVQTYVKARIPSEQLLARHIQADPTLEETIMGRIVEKSQGMFLLAKFHMDSLVTKTKRRDIRKALESLPPELDRTYDQTIERIESQGTDYSKLARRVLLWVSSTFRPLSPVELQFAIAVQPDMTELDEEDLDERDLMVSVCAGLVVLDAETNTLRFVHYTTQEYFDRKGATLFGDVHAHITMSCVTYLGFTTFADASSLIPTNDPLRRDKELRRHPLTHYAVTRWAQHARKTKDPLVIDALLRYLNKVDNVIRAVRLCLQLEYSNFGLAERFSPVHIAAMYGLENATQRLLDEGILADSRDSRGRTPLFLAAMRGEVGVVKLLVARDDVKINAQTDPPLSLTALHVAAEGIHHQVMRVLLQGGADMNFRSWRGTALHCAVRSRNISSAQILLEAGADPDIRDEEDTPVIFRAACAWLVTDQTHLTTVYTGASQVYWSSLMQLLRIHGANLKVKDQSRRTLLHVAAESCNPEVVRMLLAEGLDPHAVDDAGETPLDKALDRRPSHYPNEISTRLDARRRSIVQLLCEKGPKVGDAHVGNTFLPTASVERARYIIDRELDLEEMKDESCTNLEVLSEAGEDGKISSEVEPYPALFHSHEKITIPERKG